jgi:hypothetical protein
MVAMMSPGRSYRIEVGTFFAVLVIWFGAMLLCAGCPALNQMVEGLAERERLREAFGTYLDREVADYILSDAFD